MGSLTLKTSLHPPYLPSESPDYRVLPPFRTCAAKYARDTLSKNLSSLLAVRNSPMGVMWRFVPPNARILLLNLRFQHVGSEEFPKKGDGMEEWHHLCRRMVPHKAHFWHRCRPRKLCALKDRRP